VGWVSLNLLDTAEKIYLMEIRKKKKMLSLELMTKIEIENLQNSLRYRLIQQD
jgi:hypothetical protein